MDFIFCKDLFISGTLAFKRYSLDSNSKCQGLVNPLADLRAIIFSLLAPWECKKIFSASKHLNDFYYDLHMFSGLEVPLYAGLTNLSGIPSFPVSAAMS